MPDFKSAIFALMAVLGACSGGGPSATMTDPDRAPAMTEAGSVLPVAYYRAGDPGGQRVIFVHGTPGSGDNWSAMLDAVPPGFEYIAVDRPGFGQTGGAAEVRLKDQAAALLPLLRPADGGTWSAPPLLVGHSLGGPIVAVAAADYPDLVGGIVIIAGALDPGQEKIHPLQPVGNAWPVRALLPRIIRNANQELLALKPQLEALRPRLASLAVQVVIVHGTRDGLVPFENVSYMRAHIPSPWLVESIIVDGGNHMLPWNARDKIIEALARLSQASRHAQPTMPR